MLGLGEKDIGRRAEGCCRVFICLNYGDVLVSSDKNVTCPASASPSDFLGAENPS